MDFVNHSTSWKYYLYTNHVYLFLRLSISAMEFPIGLFNFSNFLFYFFIFCSSFIIWQGRAPGQSIGNV